jgi:hypothetical protein
MMAFRKTVGWAIFGLGIMCIIAVVVVGLLGVALLMPIHRVVTFFERHPPPGRRYIARTSKAG